MNYADLHRAVAHGQRDFWLMPFKTPCWFVGWHIDDGACIIIERLTRTENGFELTGDLFYAEADELEPMEETT